MDARALADSVAFDRAGRGEPLLLIHGIGSERCVWEPVVERLRDERDLIAVDLPGFGRSGALPDDVDPTPAVLARILAALADRLGVPRPHVAGNSLGGWIALEMGRTGTARTVTGVNPAGLWSRPLLNPSAPTRHPAREAARRLRPLLPVLMRSARLRHLALMNVVAHPERVPPHAARRMVSSYARAPAYEATSIAMRSGHFTGAREIDVPVTLGWGDRDRLLRAVPLAAPRVESVVLPDCGHVPMWDAPDLVAQLLRRGSARV